MKNRTICSQTLSDDNAGVFSFAIRSQYWYEVFIDDLPMWGFVGEVRKGVDGGEEVYVFTHKVFDISYNKERVRGQPRGHADLCPFDQ